ncbi:MAG: hypothetical protein A2W31_14215, partial [Planctomycetes bacterium RBG_16_64_10]
SAGSATAASRPCGSGARPTHVMPTGGDSAVPPGACIPWQQKRQDLAAVHGDEVLIQEVWDGIDRLANAYIWQILLSF